MVVCVPVTQVETALTCLQQAGENAWVIGEITAHATDRITISLPF